MSLVMSLMMNTLWIDHQTNPNPNPNLSKTMPNSNPVPNPKPNLSNRDAGDYLTCRRSRVII